MHKLASILGVGSVDDMYTRLVSTWPQPSRLVIEGREPALPWQDWPVGLAEPAHRMMLIDLLSYLPDDILVKVDRASMGASLEARAPLLDHRLVEFCWRLPLDQKIRKGEGKWLLRRVLERHVPRTLFERPKHGFGIPIDSWLRGPLRNWAQDLLSEERLDAKGSLRLRRSELPSRPLGRTKEPPGPALDRAHVPVLAGPRIRRGTNSVRIVVMARSQRPSSTPAALCCVPWQTSGTPSSSSGRRTIHRFVRPLPDGSRYQAAPIRRNQLNPIGDTLVLVALFRILRRFRADCVLVYAAKPVIYGSLAARLARVPLRTAMITGAGSTLGGGAVRTDDCSP